METGPIEDAKLDGRVERGGTSGIAEELTLI